MGSGGTLLSAALGSWSATQMATAADSRSVPVSAARPVAVANAAVVLSAGLDGAALVLSLARSGAVALTQSRPVVDRAGIGGSRGLPERRGYR